LAEVSAVPQATIDPGRRRTGGDVAGPQIGLRGTITVATRGEQGPGEVELAVDGGSATFIAYSEEPLQRGANVVVVDVRPNRKVDVTRLG
jgi:hypothetical protein